MSQRTRNGAALVVAHGEHEIERRVARGRNRFSRAIVALFRERFFRPPVFLPSAIYFPSNLDPQQRPITSRPGLSYSVITVNTGTRAPSRMCVIGDRVE
jgi:hypothetical protein